MTLVNRLILAVGCLLLGTTITFAQSEKTERRGERKTAEEHAQMRTEKLAESLELTDEQRIQVEALELKYAKTAAANRELQRERMKAQKEAMRENRETTRAMHDKELKAILSAEQAEKYEAIKAERKAKMEEKKAQMKEHRAAMRGKSSKVKTSPNRQ